jgi:hypothetical protein
MLLPLHPLRKAPPVLIGWDAGWASEPVRVFGNKMLRRIRIRKYWKH